jgi:hypothetical protein
VGDPGASTFMIERVSADVCSMWLVMRYHSVLKLQALLGAVAALIYT